MRLLCILFLGLTLLNCSGHRSDSPLESFEFDPSYDDKSFSDAPESAGTSSSGGGFADEYALKTLRLAKASLSQIILNSNDLLFSTFPEGKDKEWLADLILRVEHRDINEDEEHGSRYDRPLDFNYDEETEVIFATNMFVTQFPYGRFITQDRSDQLRILTEVQLDILHEVSHFLNIGRGEDTNINSEYWSLLFFAGLMQERFYCYKAEDEKLLEIMPVIGTYNESIASAEEFEEILEREVSAFSNDLGLSLSYKPESSQAILASMIYLAELADPGVALDYVLFNYSQFLDHDEAFEIYNDEEFKSFASLGSLDRTPGEYIFGSSNKFVTPLGEWKETDTEYAGILNRQSFVINRETGVGEFQYEYSIFHPTDLTTLTTEELQDIEMEFYPRQSEEIQCKVAPSLMIDISDYVGDEPVNPLKLMAEEAFGDGFNFLFE